MAQEILIDIDKSGNATVEGVGFVGTECKALTKGIEEALGTVTATKEKPEIRQARSAARTKTA